MPLYVDIAMKPKMHVYAPSEKDSIPVTLTLTPDETIKTTPAEFPAPEKYFFEPIKLTQLVYSKPFRITQLVTVATPVSRSAGVTRVVKGVLRYQACDDKVCYVPKSVPLSWTLPIGNREKRRTESSSGSDPGLTPGQRRVEAGLRITHGLPALFTFRWRS